MDDIVGATDEIAGQRELYCYMQLGLLWDDRDEMLTVPEGVDWILAHAKYGGMEGDAELASGRLRTTMISMYYKIYGEEQEVVLRKRRLGGLGARRVWEPDDNDFRKRLECEGYGYIVTMSQLERDVRNYAAVVLGTGDPREVTVDQQLVEGFCAHYGIRDLQPLMELGLGFSSPEDSN